jgi:prepilin-type N-terminal cleavage/methylation domain-containing protein
MISKLKKTGLTLIEVLIAISLFSVVMVISSSILIDIVQLEKKSTLQNAIYEDLRMVLQQLTKEIQNGAIDYEEYYSHYVLQSGQNPKYYGINYGIYGSRFYDPGNSLDGAMTLNPDDLGIECSFPQPLGNNECEVIYNLSVDLSTGQNPFRGNMNGSNAFCDNNIGHCDPELPIDQLFLIDSSGTNKTIIAPKQINGGISLGMIKLGGMDIDQNGINDIFPCLPEYNCNSEGIANILSWPQTLETKLTDDIKLANSSDLSVLFDLKNANSSFVPISPLRTNIDAQFIIHPLEDPYKAYAETEMQSHPSVTIILTVDLNDTIKSDYPGKFEPITIQTTVASGVLNRIESYPSINNLLDRGSPGWIRDTMVKYGVYANLKVSL